MIRFADSDRPIIREVYEQMDNMLGQIKDIVEPRDQILYDFISIEVEKQWEKLNIPLHALAYVLTPKYYYCYYAQISPTPLSLFSLSPIFSCSCVKLVASICSNLFLLE
jgi:hypothetical protein